MNWYRRDPHRLLMEKQLLATFYPDARLVLQGKMIHILLRVMGRRAAYVVRIDYPAAFPYRPPEAYPVAPVIEGTPHQYGGTQLCLHASNATGPQTTGKVICDWTVEWIYAYEAWLESKKQRWPEQLG